MPERQLPQSAHVQLIEDCLTKLQQGDLDTLLASVTDDFVLVCMGDELIPFSGTWQGRDGLRQFLEIGSRSVRRVAPVIIDDLVAEEDRVIMTGRDFLAHPQTGEQVEVWFTHRYIFRDGKIAHLKECFDTLRGQQVIQPE